jgi:beta-glucosidase
VFDRIGALDDGPELVERSEDLREHREIARDAAVSSFVLLKNDDVLPLDPINVRSVAVIGPNANRAIIMGGGSSSLAVPERRSPLAALRDRFGADVEFNFEPGVEIGRTAPEIPASWLRSASSNGLAVECFALDDLGGEVVHAEHKSAGTVLWFGMPPGVGSEFSWRASGTLTVPEPGRYTIVLVQTEPARLFIDGALVLDGSVVNPPPGSEFFGRATGEQTIELDLSPEKPLQIELQSQVTAGMLLGAKLGIRTQFPIDAIDRAVAVARQADAVVVVVGTDGDWDSEGHDRESLNLPGRQDELVERVLAVAPDAVVIVNAGAVVALPWASRCRALLQCWFGGVEMAEALADVLLGVSDPGGRLPTTIPHRLEDNPSWGNFPGTGGRTLYGERVLVGYRWYESRSIDVAFPFGHGLSYSDFEFGEPALPRSSFAPGEKLSVRIPVANVGSRSGAEVVQLYVEPPASAAFRPVKELKAFAKVHLEPGESTFVDLELDVRSFARWAEPDDAFRSAIARQKTDAPFMPPIQNIDAPGWVVDSGSATLHIGRSVADISHVVTIDVVGSVEASDGEG